MKNNINNFPCCIKLGNQKFLCDFDHTSIDILQSITGQGFYKIYNNFIFYDDYIYDVLITSVIKNHGILGFEKLKKILEKQKKISAFDYTVFKVHFKNLLPETEKFYNDLKSINPNIKITQEKSDFYNFEEIYPIARNYLKWSDSEFWLATPKKFCFSLISFLKHNKQKEELLKKQQTENSLNLLKGIKNLL